MDHILSRSAVGITCELCHWTWKSKPRDGGCPGLRRYDWGAWPETVASETQLRRQRLKTGGPPVACAWAQAGTYWVWLYDVAAAAPRREATPGQLEALDLARRRKDEKRDEQARIELDREIEELRQQDEEIASDRRAAEQWARGLLGRTDWVILDTETTGLVEPHVVEVAIIRPDGKELLNTRVNPLVPIPDQARAIHGITDADVAGAPLMSTLRNEVTSLLNGVSTIVTYNAEFDRGALEFSIRADMGGSSSVGIVWARRWKWECALERYSEWVGEWLPQKGRYRRVALGGGHDALGDCRACLERINEMAGVPGSRP